MAVSFEMLVMRVNYFDFRWRNPQIFLSGVSTNQIEICILLLEKCAFFEHNCKPSNSNNWQKNTYGRISGSCRCAVFSLGHAAQTKQNGVYL